MLATPHADPAPVNAKRLIGGVYDQTQRLEKIISGVESLAEMSKSHPEIFNEAVSEKELIKLEEITSVLAASIEKQIGI